MPCGRHKAQQWGCEHHRNEEDGLGVDRPSGGSPNCSQHERSPTEQGDSGVLMDQSLLDRQQEQGHIQGTEEAGKVTDLSGGVAGSLEADDGKVALEAGKCPSLVEQG